MNAADLSQLSDLRECAYRLGMAFGAEAERAETDDRRMAFFHLFDRSFFAVRVSIALELRLRREAGRPMTEREAERPDPREDEPAERELAERDGVERYDERDRDREVERATLPVLLRTLEGVAADASALSGPMPAELPTLRELLARMTAEPATEARAAPLRARLAGSATTRTLVLPSPTGRPGLRHGLPIRRATGPPRR